MLFRLKKDNIILDKPFGWNIEGKIVKFNIKCKNIPKSVKITILTAENEVLFNETIVKTNTNIYPINIIKNEGVVEAGEEFLIDEELHRDYYYVFGLVGVNIKGLQEGERIDNISIFYESEQGAKSTPGFT